MSSVNRRLLTFLTVTLSVVSFLILSSFAVVWANGLKFNKENGTFEKTVLIAIDGGTNDYSVYLNDRFISPSVPYRIRNILPGSYKLELKKVGFKTWEQHYRLSEGQIGIVNSPVLIAEKPLVTSSLDDLKTTLLAPFDYGISITSGELIDRGALVTRFATLPIQIHRYNDLYLYQVENRLRIFNPINSQDDLIYESSRGGQLPITLFPATWQVGVAEVDQVKLINLTIPASTER